MKVDVSKLKTYLKSAKEASILAGEILKGYWGKIYEIKEKTYPGNLVTEADKASELQIIDYLGKLYPSFSIIAEESGNKDVKDSDFTWVIDPLDGTTNFTHNFPMVSISIGLLYKGVPVVGVIYNPILNELFEAAKGCGAFFNSQPIAISKTKDLPYSLLVTGFAYNRRETEKNNYAEFVHMTHVSQGVRRMGSASLDLAYVAAGRFDGYWESGLQAWDIAAGIVIVEEAGGVVSSIDGSNIDIFSGAILATNGHIHETMLKELADVYR